MTFGRRWRRRLREEHDGKTDVNPFGLVAALVIVAAPLLLL